MGLQQDHVNADVPRRQRKSVSADFRVAFAQMADDALIVNADLNLTHFAANRRSKTDPPGPLSRGCLRACPRARLSCFPLVLQAVALAADLHDVCVMQQPVEHCCRQRLVVGERRGPLRERQVARQHDGAALVALGDDVEEQVRFLSPKRQISDFVNYE